MNMKSLGLIAAGIAIGATAAWVCVSGMKKQQTDETIADIRDFYEKELQKKEDVIDRLSAEPSTENVTKTFDKVAKAMTSAASSLDAPIHKDNVKDSYEKAVKYMKYSSEKDSKSEEIPEEDVSEQPEQDQNPDLPHVISQEEYYNSEKDGVYEFSSLTYYEADDTLVDEQDKMIDSISDLIGDGLEHFGDQSNDKDMVYIRNDMYGSMYEVFRNHGYYQEIVLGLTVDDPKPGLKKMREYD